MHLLNLFTPLLLLTASAVSTIASPQMAVFQKKSTQVDRFQQMFDPIYKAVTDYNVTVAEYPTAVNYNLTMHVAAEALVTTLDKRGYFDYYDLEDGAQVVATTLKLKQPLLDIWNGILGKMSLFKENGYKPEVKAQYEELWWRIKDYLFDLESVIGDQTQSLEIGKLYDEVFEPVWKLTDIFHPRD